MDEEEEKEECDLQEHKDAEPDQPYQSDQQSLDDLATRLKREAFCQWISIAHTMNGANDHLLYPRTPSEDKAMCEAAITISKIEKDKRDDAVSVLADMGFTNTKLIRTLLRNYNVNVSGNVSEVVLSAVALELTSHTSTS